MVSKQARKQRKALYNAPVHVRRRNVSAHLSDELMKQTNTHSSRVIVGDTVKVLRGDEGVKGVEGKVSDVNTKTGRIIIEGITMPKADGTMKARPVHSSNVIITKLDLTDPWRKERLHHKQEGSS
jgi:large subunit ribosomal protein L24